MPKTINHKAQPHKDDDSLVGRLMCYECNWSFKIPKNATSQYTRVKCKNPNCGAVHDRQQFMADENDPLKHPLGWPYDDPTVPYNC